MKTKLTCWCMILLSATFFVSACSSSRNSQQSDIVQDIRWQKDSVFIDGDDGDWAKPFLFLDEKLGLAYSVTNDKDNLYILATSNNEATIQRVRQVLVFQLVTAYIKMERC